MSAHRTSDCARLSLKPHFPLHRVSPSSFFVFGLVNVFLTEASPQSYPPPAVPLTRLCAISWFPVAQPWSRCLSCWKQQMTGLDRVVQKARTDKSQGNVSQSCGVKSGNSLRHFMPTFWVLCILVGWSCRKLKPWWVITVDTTFQTLMGAKNSEGGVGRKQHQWMSDAI